MTTSLSNFVGNPSKGIYRIKCKDCGCFFECESVNDNSINYKLLSCNKKKDWWKFKKLIQKYI